MSGDRSNVRGDAQREKFLRQGPSKRLMRFLEGDVGKRQLFRPSGTVPLRVQTVGRNAPCPCGSGKKYKHCCIGGAK